LARIVNRRPVRGRPAPCIASARTW
jgi:hypothetical protein